MKESKMDWIILADNYHADHNAGKKCTIPIYKKGDTFAN